MSQYDPQRGRSDTGEVRVPRLLGVFAAGRIIIATTARSQFLGGMTMGLSMALHEERVLASPREDTEPPRSLGGASAVAVIGDGGRKLRCAD